MQPFCIKLYENWSLAFALCMPESQNRDLDVVTHTLYTVGHTHPAQNSLKMTSLMWTATNCTSLWSYISNRQNNESVLYRINSHKT